MAETPATAEVRSRQLVDALRHLLSVASSNHPQNVEVIETHISWVLLTVEFAYKLKKPVKFEFLDFSTVELRRQACQAEVQLNRRLARNVYLEALPLARNADGRLELPGSGTPIDWVVKMRRLPAEKSLATLLAEHRLSARQAEGIADHVARFYASLPPAVVQADAYVNNLFQHVRANADALVQSYPESRRASGAQLRYLALQREQFVARVVAGRIVDGHGDLRPEHIFAEDPPVVIDCIEFSPELRRVDIADELAFLDMECRRIGDSEFGHRVIEKYQQLSLDAIPAAVRRFYCSYRAVVRAKVAMLRHAQQTDDDAVAFEQAAKEYVDVANCYATALGPPVLVVVGGLPATGKSTLAEHVAEAIGCRVLSTDRVRREMLGPSPEPADFAQGRYTPDSRRSIYDELFRQASHELAKSCSVVLDGTFSRKDLRREAFETAARCNAKPVFIHCQCPRDVALARMAERARRGSSNSETRPEFLERQEREFEAPARNSDCLTVDTTEPLAEQMSAVEKDLRRRLFG